ncbi:hypothetical protein PVL29_003785 [Vitis rotundifolia]|uniref:Plant basic secretory protein (BSP) family protein n=1 Tax=Vitis rotundifolia TaxID=103349 RepID=A0AA39AG87_VITRO|nr:hypothetical protein PVL29_003785 [Vitis rotundifolia]
MAKYMLLISSLVILSTITRHGILAVEIFVTNNAGNSAGGVRFSDEIGVEYSRQALTSATDFIWGIFQQNTEADRKESMHNVTLIIENGNSVAFSSNNEIHLNDNYLGEYSGDVKREFTGVVYHEMTHLWQWNGKGQAPGGLIEGIADFVRLKAYLAPSFWARPGQGDRWDEGYDVTARFLDYCNSHRDGFVAELNKKMRGEYDSGFFVELQGKTVDQLWSNYKAQNETGQVGGTLYECVAILYA